MYPVVLLCRWFLWLMGLLEGVGGIWPPFLTSRKIPRIGPQLRPMKGVCQIRVVLAMEPNKKRRSQKTAGAERAESLEKQQFWVQSGQNPWKKAALLSAERANP